MFLPPLLPATLDGILAKQYINVGLQSQGRCDKQIVWFLFGCRPAGMIGPEFTHSILPVVYIYILYKSRGSDFGM